MRKPRVPAGTIAPDDDGQAEEDGTMIAGERIEVVQYFRLDPAWHHEAESLGVARDADECGEQA
jgi:hypothetical protein